jgi:DNA polymerase-1
MGFSYLAYSIQNLIMSEKKLFLLDGHALVYRAHYAFINRPLINSQGINTSAITGFVRSLWDIIKNQNPSHLAVAFDPKGNVFRHEEFPEYKANRDAPPEDITIAFPYIEKIVKAFNIPIVKVPNYEADDVIGTLAKKAEKAGFTVYMVTPDKDYAQLVSENIYMYKPSRQGNGVDIIGPKEVLEKWNITNVLQVIDVLGLQGDSVDNIPGIPGIGAKTASKLLALYDSVENLIANTDKLKGKQKENVENFAEQGLLSKRLATIDLNVPIDFDEASLVIEEYNREALSELFRELEFRTLADQILGQFVISSPSSTSTPGKVVQQDLFSVGGNASSTSKSSASDSALASYKIVDKNIENTDHQYDIVRTDQEIAELVNKLEKQSAISFDTETTGIDATIAELVGMVFSFEKHKAYYVPVPADQAEAKRIVAPFKKVLENKNIIKIGQNIKYDILMMKWYDVNFAGVYFDTMICHYLLEPDLRHKLDYLSESYLNYKMVPIESLIGKRGKNQLSMRDILEDKVAEYAGEDADITLQIKEILAEKIKEEEVEEIYYKIEEPLIDVLANIEYEGIRVNSKFLEDYSVKLGKLVHGKEKEIYKKAGVEFNIASPKQVGQVLFDKLEIPYRWRKTSSGQYSTDAVKLEELSVKHDIVRDILNYRKYAKLKTTYVDALPQMINPRTGRVHSNFNQARAATGRLSSENPNLQNIPIKDEAGREIRKAFQPRDKDHILLAADYSQIELRLIAEISKDEAMMEAFIAGNDFHRATAAKVYGVPYEKVTEEQRRNAKTVNFSITYGAGATNLSRQLGISRKEATELIDNYFAQYRGLQNYMHDVVQGAREKGYVTTLLGRKRSLRDINSRNGLTRSNAERMAINTPIQGTAADMIKLAMINIQNRFIKENIQSKMVLQVHDELVFDVLKTELEQVKEIVTHEMKNAMPTLEVPILVSVGTGENWLEAH